MIYYFLNKTEENEERTITTGRKGSDKVRGVITWLKERTVKKKKKKSELVNTWEKS